jgi:hypothetical protein
MLVSALDLRLYRPLRRFVVLVDFSNGCSLVHLARLVMRRCVDRIDLHGFVSDIGDVVPGSCWNQHAPPIGDFLVECELILRRSHLHAAPTAIEAKKLVSLRVRLQPYVTAYRNRHQRDLEVSAAPHDRAVVLVIQSRLFEIERLWPRADVFDGHLTIPYGEIGEQPPLRGNERVGRAVPLS